MTKPSAFTLIELLVVVAIIGVLIGLLFPAIKESINKGKRAQAKADIKNIEAAIKQYVAEYGKLPVDNNDQGDPDTDYYTNAYEILNTLRAIASGYNASPDHKLNPRRIVFLEPPSRKNATDSNGNILDPWKNAYWIRLDTDYDGKITYQSTDISRNAIVICRGKNGTQENPALSSADDLVSYQ